MKNIDLKKLNKNYLLLAGLISERDGITFYEAIVKVGNDLAKKVISRAAGESEKEVA